MRNSARRWRLDARGPVKRVPRLGDAHNDVGFAAALVSQGALGTTTLLRQNYVRVRRVCVASGCRSMRTPAGSRVVERDLALLPDVPWAQGPAHPTEEEYDLETVVLHELGHWAGNLRHTPVGCHDTPMVKGLGPVLQIAAGWTIDGCDGGRARAAARSTCPRSPPGLGGSPSAWSSGPSSSVGEAGPQSLAWAMDAASCRPGPAGPPLTADPRVESAARPTAFLRRCAATYGGRSPYAWPTTRRSCSWHPDAVRAVYAADPSVARRGAAGPLRPWRARVRSSSPTARSTCASGGCCRLLSRRGSPPTAP